VDLTVDSCTPHIPLKSIGSRNNLVAKVILSKILSKMPLKQALAINVFLTTPWYSGDVGIA
jgi:hypothetical protein